MAGLMVNRLLRGSSTAKTNKRGCNPLNQIDSWLDKLRIIIVWSQCLSGGKEGIPQGWRTLRIRGLEKGNSEEEPRGSINSTVSNISRLKLPSVGPLYDRNWIWITQTCKHWSPRSIYQMRVQMHMQNLLHSMRRCAAGWSEFAKHRRFTWSLLYGKRLDSLWRVP